MKIPGIEPLGTLKGYQPSWLSRDLVAAIALISIAIPEQIATARLANMPALLGMYAFIAGSVAILIFGSTRQMSVGADSTIAPIFATSVALVATAGSSNYQHLVTMIALLAGGFVVIAGLVKLGWIADLMSTPVVDGILAGIALEIILGQLPNALGIPKGGATVLSKLDHLISNLASVNFWSLGIAISVILIVYLSEKIDRRIPGAFIALVATIACVPLFHLQNHGVTILGKVSGGLPSIGLPSINFSNFKMLLGTALTVAYVTVVQTAATARLVATETGDSANIDADLVGVGAGSLIAGLTGGFAVDSSPPRTALVVKSGGKSQLTSAFAALVMLGIALLATPLITDLPNATLAAILLVVATRLVRIKELKAVINYNKAEFALAAVAFLAIAALGIEEGVIVAILVSLAYRIRLAARPRLRVLEREIGADHWVEPSDKPTERVDSLLVYLVEGPMWFGNIQFIKRHILGEINKTAPKCKALVLDAAGVEDIDYTAAEATSDMIKELGHRNIQVVWARMDSELEARLHERDLAAQFGEDRFLSSVESAVEKAISLTSSSNKQTDNRPSGHTDTKN
ncbi:MAG: SulP family inorganic anion transporter [Acidimicrobiaceae bacterium]|nr:SulP family inorganic anion transporter [Acidimicrobiaceae bacterium]